MFKKAILCFFVLLITSPIKAQSYSSKPSWSQEFRTLGRKYLRDWSFYKGTFDIESQYYTDSIGNVYVRNGYLHIKATPDKRSNKVCSSARVSTRGHKSFLYGRFEIRAKIQTGKGIFPAIWLLSEDYPDVVYPFGEMDIMEYIDCFESKQYCLTTHMYGKQQDSGAVHYKHSKNIDADMSKYHVYGLEWTPTFISYSLDKKEIYRLEKKDAELWPFDKPYILILNVAYGNWGAQCGMDDSIFPREMIVDWIRYYPLITY